MVDIVIETMRSAHIPAVLDIEAEVFGTPWTYDVFRHEIEDSYKSHNYVALDGERLTGYMVAWFMGGHAHLLNIAVGASYQRCGVGSRLLRFLLDQAVRENIEVITLEVRESNKAAIGLYEAFGFTHVGIRHQYYQDNQENAVFMAYYLTPGYQEERESDNVAEG